MAEIQTFIMTSNIRVNERRFNTTNVQEDMAARRARLIADLERLADGWRPTADDLATAPLLCGWYFAVYPASDQICMCGAVTGHPGLHDGMITTSPIVAMDLKSNWIRTHGRFYRLGEPDVDGPFA